MYDNGATPIKLAHPTDAGYDLAALDDTVIYPGRNLVKTGVHIKLDDSLMATVRPRSGCSLKGMPDTDNKRRDADVIIGTIDAGYTGDIGIIVHYNGSVPFVIPKATRIAQLVISPVTRPNLEIVDTLGETDRGDKGFNSTGV